MSISRSQHGVTRIQAIVHDEEVVVSRKHVLVDQMHSAFLPSRTDLFAVFHEAGEDLVASITPSGEQRIVVLGDMQRQVVFRGKVLVASQTSVHVRLLVVDFVISVCRELHQGMRWKIADDLAPSRNIIAIEVDVFARLRLIRVISLARHARIRR